MRLGRDPFAELVERQLDLVVADEAELLEEITQAERLWNAAGRDDAEEAYGDLQLAVDALSDRLHDTREAYAATIDPDLVESYRASFNRRAARRFRRYPTIAADL
jgi:hypothetical protein